MSLDVAPIMMKMKMSEYVLGWFSPLLFIATHGEQMYTIGPNASQTHVFFSNN